MIEQLAGLVKGISQAVGELDTELRSIGECPDCGRPVAGVVPGGQTAGQAGLCRCAEFRRRSQIAGRSLAILEGWEAIPGEERLPVSVADRTRRAARRLKQAINAHGRMQSCKTAANKHIDREMAFMKLTDAERELQLGAELVATLRSWPAEGQVFVHDGLSNGQGWATYRRAANGSLHRVKSPALPVRESREEAEQDLEKWLARSGR